MESERIEREMAISELDDMVHYLERQPLGEKVSVEFLDKIKRSFGMGMDAAYHAADTQYRRLLIEYYDTMKAKDSATFGELLEIGTNFRDVVNLVLTRRKTGTYVERRMFERRISELQGELASLRSNPSLEKKVAKLEEEVRKVRLSSVATSETEGKEQEDILRKYRSSEKKVFVIMPFAPSFDDVWIGGIQRASTSVGFASLRVDKISLSTWITEDMEKCIEMADVVVSDITGSNPNVMFELGWALAKGKKPIVIRQQDDSAQVPFDVKDIRYIPYINSWSGIESLCKQICKFMKSTSEALEKPSKKQERNKKKTD